MKRESPQLTLSIRTYKGEPIAEPRSQQFSEAGGTVGRLPTNDLVLVDPARVISGCHARIRYDQGGYFLDDLSTNGVFVNGAVRSIGKGNSVRLARGDTLRMGDFELRVEIVVPSPVPYAAEDPFVVPPAPRQAPTEPPDPMDLLSAIPRSRRSEPGDDPFVVHPPVRQVSQSVATDDERDPLELLGAMPSARSGTPSIGARSDHTPAESFNFEPPRAHTEAIPDDWDLSGIWPATPPAAAPVPASGAMAETRRRVIPQVQSARAAAARSPDAGDDAGAAYALMTAAGLPADAFDRRRPDELLRDAGGILATIVGGLMELLAERAAFKGEFRIDHTTIGPNENNPLKFARDARNALEYLLFPSGAFLEGEAAVRQGVQDLKNHRVATLAAMRAAFEALLHHFDPERLEASFEEGSRKAAMMRIGGKSRAWEKYRQYYEELKRDPELLFREVIGEAFVAAYEAQLERLERDRG